VFTGAHGGYLRRSNFNRCIWTPAASGDPDRNVPPVITGMHFHDLRHTHKTWLIEDDIPEIAQAKQLGHRLPGIRGVYSHAPPPCSNASPTRCKPAGTPTDPATSTRSMTRRPGRHNPRHRSGRSRRPSPLPPAAFVTCEDMEPE